MTADSDSLPPTGTATDQDETVTPEELTPEEVENLGSALKRLAIGAARERDVHDRITVTPDRGWSYNGVVHTIIDYPFGFEATVSASTLRKTLAEITDPSIRVTEKGIMVEEGPKRVRLSKSATRALENNHVEPETYTDAVGRWFRWLKPTVPTQSGRFMFPGVYMCPEGYVGQDGKLLGHVKVAGPEVPTIVPMNLINVLPAKTVQLGCGPTAVWAKDETTTWVCPALIGEYPPWPTVFTGSDQTYRVNRHELLAAIRLVAVTDRQGELLLSPDKAQFESRPSGDTTDSTANHSRAEFEATPTKDTAATAKLVLDNSRFLNMLSVIEADTILISTDSLQTRIQVWTVEQQPEVSYVLMAVRGQGDLPGT